MIRSRRRPAAGGMALKRMTPKQFLEQSGIVFPKNAFVVFDARTSTLSMRNTAENHLMLEGMVERARTSLSPQVSLECRMLEVQEHTMRELGFDWLLGAMGVGDGVAVAGGADPGFSEAGGLPFIEPGLSQTPVGQNPVTAGNRSGQQAITGRAMDKLLAAGVAADLSATKGRAPTALAMAGVLSEPRFQVVMRALSQSKGIDFLNAPTVVTRSGLPARIDVVREMIVPTEYDPPEIPNEVGLGNAGGLVTPSTPTAFDMKPVGSILEVEPVVSADGTLVEVNVDTLHREFLGFINYGSPIRALQGTQIRPDNAVTVTENRILQPVFETRHLKSSTSVYDGQTLVIGGLMHENLERVDDKVPLLGDLPVLGRFFKSKAGDSQKRVLLIFLKVDALDPAGKPMRESLQAGPVEP